MLRRLGPVVVGIAMASVIGGSIVLANRLVRTVLSLRALSSGVPSSAATMQASHLLRGLGHQDAMFIERGLGFTRFTSQVSVAEAPVR